MTRTATPLPIAAAPAAGVLLADTVSAPPERRVRR